MTTSTSIFETCCATENLFQAWFDFRRGKMKRPDVLEFNHDFEARIFSLQRQLKSGRYRHGRYRRLCINDPKSRTIRCASVIDRVVHQAISKTLEDIFDNRFIYHAYSGRKGKGIHAGVLAVEKMVRRVSKNYRKRCFYLKADISKFYDSVDHRILMTELSRYVPDVRMQALLEEVVTSFSIPEKTGTGLPIGNVTSQLFTNVYLNRFDHWIKGNLRVKHYARYCDDFVVVADSQRYLEDIRERIKEFLFTIKLSLHPHKVAISSLHHGLDFLGYVLLPHHRKVRSKTVGRMFRVLDKRAGTAGDDAKAVKVFVSSLQSYLGHISHANSHKLSILLKNSFCRVL